jgi:hypothetical protein
MVITDQVRAELRLGAGRRGARQAGVRGVIAHQPAAHLLKKAMTRSAHDAGLAAARGITAGSIAWLTPKKPDWHAGQLRI